MKQGTNSILDTLKDKAHSLLKKLTLLYKEASKIDSAYNGTIDLMKGWSKSTNSSKKDFIDKLLHNLESFVDTVDVKSYKDKIAVFKQREATLITECQQNFRNLCESLETEIAALSESLVSKSRRFAQLKAEMDKVEPGKQIPATLKTDK